MRRIYIAKQALGLVCESRGDSVFLQGRFNVALRSPPSLTTIEQGLLTAAGAEAYDCVMDEGRHGALGMAEIKLSFRGNGCYETL